METDEQGEFEWEDCEECDGSGVVSDYKLEEVKCFHCTGGRVKRRVDEFDEDSFDDYEFEHDTTCIVMADDSPLCDPSAVIKEEDGTETIPW